MQGYKEVMVRWGLKEKADKYGVGGKQSQIYGSELVRTWDVATEGAGKSRLDQGQKQWGGGVKKFRETGNYEKIIVHGFQNAAPK